MNMRHIRELFDLTQKVVVVTGGAGKYGFGIVEGLAEASARVIIASRDEENCRAKAQEFSERGLRVKGAHVDLADEASIIQLRDSVLCEYGQIDILVNNAVGRFGGKECSQGEIWEQSMSVNAVGLNNCTTRFLEPMISRESGNIINIASMYGVVAQNPRMYPGTGIESSASGDYYFHRAGIINYTRYLAARYAEYNIRANCVSPGGLLAGQPTEFLQQYNARVPLSRMAYTEDIKGAIVYLASDASAYVTGHNLVVDGGWTIW